MHWSWPLAALCVISNVKALRRIQFRPNALEEPIVLVTNSPFVQVDETPDTVPMVVVEHDKVPEGDSQLQIVEGNPSIPVTSEEPPTTPEVKKKKKKRRRLRKKTEKTYGYKRKYKTRQTYMQQRLLAAKLWAATSTLPPTTTEEPVIIDKTTGTTYTQAELRSLCAETRRIGNQFGIRDIANFAAHNCLLIRISYPHVTCEQIGIFLEYCEKAGVL